MSDPINYIDANGETPLVIVGVAAVIGGAISAIATAANGGSAGDVAISFIATSLSIGLGGLAAIPTNSVVVAGVVTTGVSIITSLSIQALTIAGDAADLTKEGCGN